MLRALRTTALCAEMLARLLHQPHYRQAATKFALKYADFNKDVAGRKQFEMLSSLLGQAGHA